VFFSRERKTFVKIVGDDPHNRRVPLQRDVLTARDTPPRRRRDWGDARDKRYRGVVLTDGDPPTWEWRGNGRPTLPYRFFHALGTQGIRANRS
jgi:hypothetical protein